MSGSSERRTSDEELLRCIVGGGEPALAELYRRHRPLLRKVVLGVLHSEDDTEEVLQDVFLKIWKSAAIYDVGNGAPLGWMICMSRRRAIDRLRRTHRKERLRTVAFDPAMVPDIGELAPVENGASSDDCTSRRDLRRCLAAVIATLSDQKRLLLDLAFFGEMSQRQITAHTGIPLGTVKSRLRRGLLKLQQQCDFLRHDLS